MEAINLIQFAKVRAIERPPITNFYKTFKKLTGKTPQEYQQSYLG